MSLKILMFCVVEALSIVLKLQDKKKFNDEVIRMAKENVWIK
jgi:hypothetical protein